MSRSGAALFAVLTASCAAPAPADPFVAGDTVALDSPARSMAVVVDGERTVAFVAREFQSDVVAFVYEAGSWSELFRQPVGQGPRSICAEGSTVVVASTSAASIDSFFFDGTSLTPVASAPIDAPLAVACGRLEDGDEIDVAVVSGLDEAARSVRVMRGAELVADGDAFSIPSADSVHLLDVDDDGNDEVVVLAGTRGTLDVLGNDGGALASPFESDLGCDSPRAAAVFEGPETRALAVACDGAIVTVSGALSDQAQITSVAAPAQLYDLVSGDFDGDGRADWATIDISGHHLVLWLAVATDQATQAEHDVARGPIALASVDLEADADADLVVLSLEQAEVSAFSNETF